MSIQNAPLTKELKDRIQKFVFDMGNIVACSKSTGIATKTLNDIMKREWASIDHMKKLVEYCDKVAGFTVENLAD